MTTLGTLTLAASMAAACAGLTYAITPQRRPRVRYHLALGVWTAGCAFAPLAGFGRSGVAVALAMLAWGGWRVATALRADGPPSRC